VWAVNLLRIRDKKAREEIINPATGMPDRFQNEVMNIYICQNHNHNLSILEQVSHLQKKVKVIKT